MRGLRQILVFVALVGIVAVPAARPVAATDPALTSDLADQVRFRSAFGLRTDREFLESLALDPATSREFGVPLAPNEVAAIKTRDANRLRIDKVVEAVESGGDKFGGVYFDHTLAGVLHVVVVDPLVTRAAVEALLPVEVPFVLEPGTNGLASLRAMQANVDKAMFDLRRDGIEIVSTSVDVKGNRLAVGVVNPSFADEAKLQARFGPAVAVVPDEYAEPTACNSRADCGPPTVSLRGGLVIDGGGITCTSGYLGKEVAGPNMYMITAGHCVHYSGTGVNWFHNGVKIGPSGNDHYFFGTHADVATIRILADPADDNRVYVTLNDQRRFAATYTNGQMPVGAPICRSGKTSGYDCGWIVEADVSFLTTDLVLVNHAWKTDFPSALGDSGGPMMFGTTLGGIQSSAKGNSSYYGTVSWITNVLGVRPCLADTC